MPERISRNEMLAGMLTSNKIQSVTWRRRVNKVVKRCVNCDAETASHNGDRFCNPCNAFVATYDSREANEGDLVTMQFIPKIPPNGTKNFTPAGGFIFNAPTLEDAQRILRENGLVQALKMGETIPELTEDGEIRRRIATGDLQALPRVIPIPDVLLWKSEGVEYAPVD